MVNKLITGLYNSLIIHTLIKIFSRILKAMRSFETSGSFNPRTLRHCLSDATAKTLEIAFGNCCPLCSNRFLNVATVVHRVQIVFWMLQLLSLVFKLLSDAFKLLSIMFEFFPVILVFWTSIPTLKAKWQQTQTLLAPLPIWNRTYSTKTQKDIIKMDVIVTCYKRLSFNINVVRHLKSLHFQFVLPHVCVTEEH